MKRIQETTHPLTIAAQIPVRAIMIALLVLAVALTLQVQAAYAAPLEDCDLDGFDDSTGVAVPWPGYDETRGDTPAGPGTADWWIKQNEEAAAKRNDSSSGSGNNNSGSPSSNSGSNSSGNSGSGGNTGSPSSGSGNNSSGGGSSSPSGSGNNNSGSPSSGSGGNSSGNSGSGGNANSPSSGSDGSAGTAADVSTTDIPQAVDPAALVSDPATVGVVSSTEASVSDSVENSTESSAVAAVGISDEGGPVSETNTFWEALTVGFTDENKQLLVGLSLLAALASAGGLALGFDALRGMGSHSRQGEGDLQGAEEPAAGIA